MPNEIFWRAIRNRKRIGQPWLLQYGYTIIWGFHTGARISDRWYTCYEQEYPTQVAALGAQKFKQINGAPVVGKYTPNTKGEQA